MFDDLFTALSVELSISRRNSVVQKVFTNAKLRISDGLRAIHFYLIIPVVRKFSNDESRKGRQSARKEVREFQVLLARFCFLKSLRSNFIGQAGGFSW